MTIQCCKCNRIETPSQWIHVYPLPKQPVSYSYCPDCLAEARRGFSEELRQMAQASAVPAVAF